jgi:hypothetical protein
MTRSQLIEQIIRQVYGNQPTDDASITPNLVNQFINQGIGVAVKLNYKDAIQMDGVGYVNNSFYTTFKGLPITQDEAFKWKIALPSIPLGVGQDEGISTLVFKNNDGKVSLPVIWLSQNQVTYYQSLPTIANKILAYSEGGFVYALSPLLLDQYTATVTLISGGDSTNLSSTLNVPDDYISVITEYAVKSLMAARAQIQDSANDGNDKN